MALTAGTRIGPYEVTSRLGEGGMGVVFRAHDTKLQRDVALKLLPDHFAGDADRLARFQREAQLLATLNHPNIAHVYGLEESGAARCIVMELVDGETLHERLMRAPMPIDEALPIMKQIAEALEAAHERGIIHRDLKPANIKLTPGGNVKVLDFGLAKIYEAVPPPQNISNSPTVSAMQTAGGMILGTAAYMAPEQARGKNVDRRADVWAFGCVLFEMLTGKRAFEGEEVTDTLAYIITKEPDWRALPAALPSSIHRLLRRCLQKDPRHRLRDFGDARLEIDDASNDSPIPTDTAVTPGAKNRALPWVTGIAAGLAIGLIGILAVLRPWQAPPRLAAMRLSTEIGADVSLAVNVQGNAALAISSDGILAFVAEKNGTNQIYIRRLGQLQATPLTGTFGAINPFFSPDGQWIAFFADGRLKKMSVNGGAAVTLCEAPAARGGSWGDDGNIVFYPDANQNLGLLRVSSAGGRPEALTKLGIDEAVHRWPYVLPGAKAVLYTASSNRGAYLDANIVVQPLPAGPSKVVVRGGYHAQFLSSGHLVYIHDGTLFTVPFDVGRLETSGPPVPAVEGVSTQVGTGAAEFAVSDAGTFVYVPGESTGNTVPIFWMTRDGKTSPLRAMPLDWSNPQFAPDGRRLAIDINDARQNDVWIYEWARDTLTRLTFDSGDDRKPVWTPDGRRIVFVSTRDKTVGNLFWQRSDGTGEVQRLTQSQNPQYSGSWHPSGKYLAFWENSPQTASDLMILPMEGDEASGWKPGKPTTFLNTPATETEPMFSPDGRWIAYTSNESGRPEVFVRPFPGPGGKWQISSAGGLEATWSRTRKELLFRALDNRIMVASYLLDGDSFKADKPRLWSEQPIVFRPRQRAFDLHPDGERISAYVAVTQTQEKRDKAIFVFNFFDELRRLTGK